MENNLPRTFISGERAVARDRVAIWLFTFGIVIFFIVRFAHVGFIIGIPASLLLYWIFGKTKGMEKEQAGLFYNMVELSENGIVFSIRDKKGNITRSDKYNLSNFESVIVRDVAVDSAVSGKTLKAYEFKHKYDFSKLVRYDIKDRSDFERILKDKGFTIGIQPMKVEDCAPENPNKANVTASENRDEEKYALDKNTNTADTTIDEVENKVETEKSRFGIKKEAFASTGFMPYSSRKGVVVSFCCIMFFFIFMLAFRGGEYYEYGQGNIAGVVFLALMNSSEICLFLCAFVAFSRLIRGRWFLVVDARWFYSLFLVSLSLLAVSGLFVYLF